MKLSLVLSIVLLAGCGLFGSPEHWLQREVEGPPLRELKRICTWAAVQADFPPPLAETEPGRLVSGWDIQLSPFASRGTRARAIVAYERQEDGDGWLLKVRVEEQRNTEFGRPSDLEYAKWGESYENEQRASTVLFGVVTQLGEGSEAGFRSWERRQERESSSGER